MADDIFIGGKQISNPNNAQVSDSENAGPNSAVATSNAIPNSALPNPILPHPIAVGSPEASASLADRGAPRDLDTWANQRGELNTLMNDKDAWIEEDTNMAGTLQSYMHPVVHGKIADLTTEHINPATSNVRTVVTPDGSKIAFPKGTTASKAHAETQSWWDKSVQKAFEIVGSVIPESATPALEAGMKYYVTPTEKALGKVGEAAVSSVQSPLAQLPPKTQAYLRSQGVNPEGPMPEWAKGINEESIRFSSQMLADPRMWPFFGEKLAVAGPGVARQVLGRALSGVIAGQMSASAVEGVQKLSNDWDSMSVKDRAAAMTGTVMSTIMAGLSGYHAAAGTGVAPKSEEAAQAQAAYEGPERRAGERKLMSPTEIEAAMKNRRLHDIQTPFDVTAGASETMNRDIAARLGEPVAVNASGESAASLEAINRAEAQKTQGIQTFRVDSRSGNAVPIPGIDATDAKANPYEHIVQVQDGAVKQIQDSASNAKPLDEQKLLQQVAPQTVGTAAGAEQDTKFFQQAKDALAPNASVSDIALKAQELKTDAAKPKVIPPPKDIIPTVDPARVAGGAYATPAPTYHEAATTKGNPWVRSSADPYNNTVPTNEGRQLLVQISSNLIHATAGTADDAAAYYDKLYSGARPGYARMEDFWEIPTWISMAAHMLPDADVYVVRDVPQAIKFMNEAKYDHVMFSALDTNKSFIRDIAKGYNGKIIAGGYVQPTTFFDLPNVEWHDSLESMANKIGVEPRKGVDYRHFQGSDTIPRLTMSDGCLHKCAFCVIGLTNKVTPVDTAVIDQQADAIANLGAKLTYISDKTFGQAPNYEHLADLNERVKAKNPNFQGFIVQTTAAQLGKLPESFLAKSGIKYVELGIESYNDPLLKEMHKPATEKIIDQSVNKLRKLGITLIPNILVGYPGETPDTYQHTLDFLQRNDDIISHANVYNLALYENTELGQQMTTANPADFNENVLEKSWHSGQGDIHQVFAGKLYGMAQAQLDKTITPEAAMAGAHNQYSGFTYNPTTGFVRQAPPKFSVAGGYPELDHVIAGAKVTPAEVKEYASRPAVQDALKEDPKNSIGGYVYKGNTLLEVSKTFDNKDEAIEHAKATNQESIYDHAKQEVIPTGGTAADEALQRAGLLPGTSATSLGAAAAKPSIADQLRTKYGTTDDVLKAGFIFPEGDMVPLVGEHDHMLGAKTTDNAREAFIRDSGTIRARYRMSRTGEEQVFSLPAEITEGQARQIRAAAGKLRNGNIVLETVDGKNHQSIDFPTGTKVQDALEGLVKVKSEYFKSVGAAGAAPAPTAGIPERIAKGMLGKEVAGVTKTPAATQKFLDTMGKIPEVQEYTDIALQGEGARHWYQRSAKAFEGMAKESPEYFSQPGDKEKFLGMLAGSSPRQSVAMNMRETLRTWKAWIDAGRPELSLDNWKAYEKAGRPDDPKFATEQMLAENLTPAGTKVPNIIKAMNGEDLWPDLTKNKNFKVPSFERNLKGWLGHVTNDGWMALFAGLDPKDIEKPTSYHPMSVATRAAAENLGWEPAEAQAAIWSFTQALTERGEEDPNIIRQYSEDFSDIMAHDPETRGLLQDLGVQLDKLDEHLRAIGEKPEVTGRTSATTARSIGKLKERIETARGKGYIPPPKSAQGEFGFREEHPVRAPRDTGTEFNPEELEQKPIAQISRPKNFNPAFKQRLANKLTEQLA